jgi:ribosome maturation factor RimP
MSEAQQIIAKNYENLCNDIGLDPMDLEFNKEVYATVRSLVYDWMYDYSTLNECDGFSNEERRDLKEDYKANKYEVLFNQY